MRRSICPFRSTARETYSHPRSSVRSPDDAVGVAVDYTVECLRETMRDPNHVSYGVNFETTIPYLLTRLGLAAGE